MPISGFTVVGHAIVSADGMIADAAGLMPQPLRNDSDFRLFQEALDQASLVVLGREGHLRHPNPGRRRLVFTSGTSGLAADGNDRLATFYNPAALPLADALVQLKVPPGIIAVTGGKRVFDHFAPLYDEFQLAEVNGFVLPGGIPCFSAGHPRYVLAAKGLLPASTELIDAENGVTLTRCTQVRLK